MSKQSNTRQIEDREIGGLKTRTFIDEHGRIEAIIATEEGSTIVAIPLIAVGRDNPMGDEEYECLKKCRSIEDLQERANCILKCPTSKKYRVYMV